MRRIPLLCVVALAACGLSESDAGSPTPSGGTVGGVGVLPATTAAGGSTTATSSPATSSSPDSTGAEVVANIGEQVDGNRVLIIGDSILASTSKRYSNDMCTALEPLGWQVELDAEPNRSIEFADRVLDRRLDADWDAIVIGLGSNYGGDQQQFREQLEETIVRVSPRPVVLVTVTEFEESRAEVNDVHRLMDATYDNVVATDWVEQTRDADDLLGADGLHLSDEGRVALAEHVAGYLGEAPEQPGDCLSSSFTNDSEGDVRGSSNPPPTTKRPSNPPPTTRRPSTATTMPVATTTPPPPATTTPRVPRTTVPRNTNPPQTDPPPTNPPPTEPPPNT
jgi:hypothetical protein